MASNYNLSSTISMLWSRSPDKLSKLSDLKTNRERIDYICSSHLFDYVFDIVPSSRHGKSANLSDQLRAEGNRLFKQKQYEEALEKYNESVLLAPYPEEGASGDETTKLAVAFNNRSAALFHLKKYSSCLKDVEHSLEFGYPPGQAYKLYERAGRCLVALSRLREARKAFESALASIEQSALQPSDKQKWSRSICAELKELSKSANAVEHRVASRGTTDCTEIPELSAGIHPDLPNASSLVSLDQSEALGRFLVASGPLRPGDVVFSEKPYAAVLHVQFYKSHCFCCHVAVSLPYPCPRCSEVLYCSRECQSRSWSVHRVECTHLYLMAEDWVYKIGHLALRAVVSATPELLRSASGLGAPCDVTSDYSRFCRLVTHEDDRDPATNIQLVVMAVYLTKVLASLRFLKGLDDRLLTEHLLHALQVVQCNGIAVAHIARADMFSEGKPQSIGQAVYLSLALVNHSCDPDLELCFYGNQCVARVIKSVGGGRMVCSDYGQVFTLEPKAQRRRHLRDGYYFICDCTACHNDWPMFAELNDSQVVLKCPDCHHPLPAAAAADVLTCTRCDAQLPVVSTVTQLSQSHDKYAVASQQASCGRLLEALPVLLSHLELLDKFVCQPWKEYYSCQATVKQCFRLLGAKYGQNCAVPR